MGTLQQRARPFQEDTWQPRHAYPIQVFDPGTELLVTICYIRSCTLFSLGHHEPCRGSRPAQCPEGQATSAVASTASSPMASSQGRFWTYTWLSFESCVHRWVQTRSGQISETQELTPQSQRSSPADKGYASCSNSDDSSKTCRGER